MASKTVTVYVDGEAREVPRRTFSAKETYDVLGLPEGSRVAYDYARECYLDFSHGWGFVDGMHYVSEHYTADKPTDTEPWVRDANWWRS